MVSEFSFDASAYRNKLLLSIDSYGEAFDKRAGDTTFDTRFYEDLTVSLNVPIWGNLIFAPQVETFFYQNKVVHDVFQVNHYLLVSSSVKLEYSLIGIEASGWRMRYEVQPEQRTAQLGSRAEQQIDNPSLPYLSFDRKTISPMLSAPSARLNQIPQYSTTIQIMFSGFNSDWAADSMSFTVNRRDALDVIVVVIQRQP